ncbi:hypothetical protein LSAT2_018834, partial [Lamellibrachia satsuma]
AELADRDSPEYLHLANDVNTVLDEVYAEVFGSSFMDIKNIIFSNGSVVSDYEVWLNDQSSDYAVQEVLVNYVAKNNGKLGNFTVTVASSFLFTSDSTDEPVVKCGLVAEEASSNTGVIVGSVLGSLAPIAVIVGVLVYFCYYKKKPNKIGIVELPDVGAGDDRKKKPNTAKP